LALLSIISTLRANAGLKSQAFGVMVKFLWSLINSLAFLLAQKD